MKKTNIIKECIAKNLDMLFDISHANLEESEHVRKDQLNDRKKIAKLLKEAASSQISIALSTAFFTYLLVSIITIQSNKRHN